MLTMTFDSGSENETNQNRFDTNDNNEIQNRMDESKRAKTRIKQKYIRAKWKKTSFN